MLSGADSEDDQVTLLEFHFSVVVKKQMFLFLNQMAEVKRVGDTSSDHRQEKTSFVSSR